MPLWIFDILSNLAASFIFLFVILFFLRPSISIGKEIASHLDEDGNQCFRIKFYNKSWFSAYDISIDLRELEEVPAQPHGKDVYVRNVALTTSKFPYLPRWIPDFCLKNYAHHCIQVKTFEDVTSILNNRTKSLQVRIVLRHGLTGLSKNYVKNFQTVKAIKKGEFEFGNCLEIK